MSSERGRSETTWRFHLVGQAPFHELGRREVHGEPQTAVVALPFAHLACRRAQDPRADREDQTGEVGLREEALRKHEAELGVLPAQERLDADDLATHREDRLVVKHTGGGRRAVE